MKIFYWFDAEKDMHIETIDSKSRQFDIDASHLSNQLHTLNILIKDENGWGAVSSRCFIKIPQSSSIIFWYDQDYLNTSFQYSNDLVNNSDNVISTFELDTESLPKGLHYLNYIILDENKRPFSSGRSFFLKIPDGEKNILQYAYWVNDDLEKINIVKVDNTMPTMQISQLMAVEPYPILSKSFHFKINESGIPTIYAKNKFNILVFDRSYRSVYNSKEYIDTNVSREITDFEPIKSMAPKTKSVPGQNEIHWFKTEALSGDSMAIKASSACMMEIFSPKGDRLYEVSDKQSTVLEGCRAPEDGTYYIALHDMATQKSGNVTLTYQLFDKLPRGDANGDGLINVTDVATTIDEILGKKPANLVFLGADVDRDKEISIADVSLITDLVLGNDIYSYLNSMRVAPLGEYYPSLVSVDDFIIRNNHDETIYIKVEDYDSFIAAQLDMHLPEGLSISDVALVNDNSSSHSLVWRRLEEGNDYRLIAFSMGNQTFSSSDIIAVTVHAEENAAVDGTNVVLNNIVLNSYNEQHSIIKQQFVADTMCSVYGDITSTVQVDNDEWSFKLDGLRLYITVPSSCTKVMTDTLGRFCVLYLNEGENVVDMLSTGVYILDGKKIIVK